MVDREIYCPVPLGCSLSGQDRLKKSEQKLTWLSVFYKLFTLQFLPCFFDRLSASHCPQLSSLMVASFGGCHLVKKCAEVAFGKHHRAMLAGDMVQEVGPVFHSELELHFSSHDSLS